MAASRRSTKSRHSARKAPTRQAVSKKSSNDHHVRKGAIVPDIPVGTDAPARASRPTERVLAVETVSAFTMSDLIQSAVATAIRPLVRDVDVIDRRLGGIEGSESREFGEGLANHAMLADSKKSGRDEASSDAVGAIAAAIGRIQRLTAVAEQSRGVLVKTSVRVVGCTGTPPTGPSNTAELKERPSDVHALFQALDRLDSVAESVELEAHFLCGQI